MPYPLDLVHDRFSGGFNYYGDRSQMAGIQTDGDEISLSIWSRDKNGGTVMRRYDASLDDFNKNLIEDDPIGGLSSTRYGLVHSSVLPTRHNRFNFANDNVTFTSLSHSEVQHRTEMLDAFVPVYHPLEMLIEQIARGDRLGGALNQFYGISVTTADSPMLFFNTYPCGIVDIDTKLVTIFRSGWSYFEEARALFEPMFKCRRE